MTFTWYILEKNIRSWIDIFLFIEIQITFCLNRLIQKSLLLLGKKKKKKRKKAEKQRFQLVKWQIKQLHSLLLDLNGFMAIVAIKHDQTLSTTNKTMSFTLLPASALCTALKTTSKSFSWNMTTILWGKLFETDNSD